MCGLSGGVDSATAAALVHRAVGDQLTCVLVDHGLPRKNEAEQVAGAFREGLGIPLVHVDAADRFLDRLAGVTDPELKRKIVGEEFIRVFEEEAAKLTDARFLVQGTLYSDVIESGGDGRAAATIKSHHNVGGLPEDSGSTSSSRCECCSRTRSARSPLSSGCRTGSCGASRSQDPGWRFASSAER